MHYATQIIESHSLISLKFMNKKSLKISATALALSLSLATYGSPASAATINQTCKKAGLASTAKSKGKTVKVKCTKVGKKLRWVQIKSTTTTVPVPAATVSQKNAARSAASYLRYQSFSREGLIKQLQFEGFSLEDATYGVDSQKADWFVQAVKEAASYLRSSAFSRSGLIKQMEFEGFSNAEAVHGVDSQKADWNAQAAKSAASYLKSSAFSRTGLIDQLLYEGFSQAEAEFGVNSTGL